MRIFAIFFIVFFLAYADEQYKILSPKERQETIVECANSHLEACDLLLNNGVPTIKACNVRTECEFVGWLYAQVQDYTESLGYLQKACKSRYWASCDKLGFSYQRLNNYKKAKKYYEIACNNHNMSGCFNLAMLYYDGLGVRQDYQIANTLYQKICDKKEGIGCLHLGMSYLYGYGVIQNTEMAQQYIQKGCELGNNESCNIYDEYIQTKEIEVKN